MQTNTGAAPDQTGRWGDNYGDAISNRYHRNRIILAMRFLRQAGSLKGKRIYDFGCGEGVLMRAMTEEGAVTLGCDTSPELVRRAPAAANLGTVECLEAEPDHSLDGLVALNVLAFLTSVEQGRFWHAARCKLKPGGILLHTAANKYGTSPNRDHFTVEDPATYAATLKTKGFTEISRGYTGYYGTIFRWHRLSQLVGWDHIAKRFGFWSRGGRVYHPWRLALAPMAWREKRSNQINSLSRRD